MTLLMLTCGRNRFKNPLVISRQYHIHRTSRNFRSTPLSGLPVHGSTQSKRLISSGRKQSFYEVLKISPRATQAQVKKAYYALSKTYHPDQYKGKEDAARIFRDITEAYEVIGNLQKRRLYDKGLYTHSGVAATPQEAEQYAEKFYEGRKAHRRMPSSGRTPIYNFDEWSNIHYSASFKRRQDSKAKYEKYKISREQHIYDAKADNVIMAILLLCMAFAFQHSFRNDYDAAESKSPKSTKSE